MSNLLPLQYEKIQKKRARARAVLISSQVALGCALVAALALFPLYVTLRAERTGIEERTAIVKELQKGGQLNADRAEMARIRAVIDAVPQLKMAQGKIGEALQAALTKLPASISVDTVSYKPGEKGQLILSGVAQKREDIAAYRDILRATPLFTDVSVPVSALAGAEEGRFSVTIIGTF